MKLLEHSHYEKKCSQNKSISKNINLGIYFKYYKRKRKKRNIIVKALDLSLHSEFKIILSSNNTI